MAGKGGGRYGMRRQEFYEFLAVLFAARQQTLMEAYRGLNG